MLDQHPDTRFQLAQQRRDALLREAAAARRGRVGDRAPRAGHAGLLAVAIAIASAAAVAARALAWA